MEIQKKLVNELQNIIENDTGDNREETKTLLNKQAADLLFSGRGALIRLKQLGIHKLCRDLGSSNLGSGIAKSSFSLKTGMYKRYQTKTPLDLLEKLGGLVHSQQVLLALTQKGASRENAYEMVQSNAMKVWETPEHMRKDVYKKLLKNDVNVIKFLSEDEIDNLFNIKQHFVHVDHIFNKVFESEEF